MKVEVEKDRSLFIGGPCAFEILRGRGHVFGRNLKKGDKVFVPKNKAVPYCALEKSLLEVNGGSVSEILEDLIPKEWLRFSFEVSKEQKKPLKIVVLGGVDVGKTSFAVFLLNRLTQQGKKVAVIDADIGQSDIGPPTTVGLGFAEQPTFFMSDVKVVDAFFVGLTSPAGLFHRVVLGMHRLLKEAEQLEPDVLVVDTTGWVHSRQARDLKYCVIQVVEPDYIVLLQKENEVEHLVKPYAKLGVKVVKLPASPLVRARSREERHELRSEMYRKEFLGGKEVEISIDDVGIAYGFLGSGGPLSEEEKSVLSEILGIEDFYAEIAPDVLLVLTREPVCPSEQQIKALKETFEKQEVVVTSIEEVKHLLVALQGRDGKFLGLGSLLDFDWKEKKVKIFTRVNPEDIACIQVGYIRVSPEGEEEGWVKPWPI